MNETKKSSVSKIGAFKANAARFSLGKEWDSNLSSKDQARAWRCLFIGDRETMENTCMFSSKHQELTDQKVDTVSLGRELQEVLDEWDVVSWREADK